ncbi:MAG: TolC family protein [Phycisphaerales bacterium]|nr:TolC family protein [Phycisphaerales bacterium]MCI0675976.1 TolC family protein [Phycisphaerales bacterium]
MAQAVARELATVPDPQEAGQPMRIQTTQPESDVVSALAGRREELDAIGPLGTASQPVMELGEDLTGRPQQRVEIGLDSVITATVRQNLGIQASRLQPGISEQELIAAEAVFDWLLFGSLNLTKTDEPQFVPVIGGFPLGTAFAASDNTRFETGVRKRLDFGAEVTLATSLLRFQNNDPGIAFNPNPAYTARVILGITQPLLRGFGTEVNRATIRLARNQRERSVEQLESDLHDTVLIAENAYWDLLFAWRNLAITEWLVDVGVRVRTTLEGRRELDVTPAEYADAVARVEQRRAEVIRAQRVVRAASDRLKQLINDPEMLVGSEAALFPIDQPAEAPITFSLRESILTAIDNRPEIRQAALTIDDADIRVAVESNNRLPLLNLAAQSEFVGLDDTASNAYGDIDGDFIDYIIGLTFEVPLGNRAAEAGYEAARLRRSSSVLTYRQVVQDVILDVKAALRDVLATYELVAVTRSFRIAQAENLRALLVEEETLAGLTPEFLNLKFTRQETLATARRDEIAALVNFDKSLAELYRAMGIALKMKRIDVEVVDETE